MQLYNSIFYGASFNNIGNKLQEEAKILASYKNYINKTDSYTKSFENNLSAIKNYRPDKILKVQCEETNTPDYKVNVSLDGKTIFKHEGSALEFINDLASAIKNGRIPNTNN